MQSKQQFIISQNIRQIVTTKAYTFEHTGEIEYVYSKHKTKTMSEICIRTVTDEIKEFVELNSMDFREK